MPGSLFDPNTNILKARSFYFDMVFIDLDLLSSCHILHLCLFLKPHLIVSIFNSKTLNSILFFYLLLSKLTCLVFSIFFKDEHVSA